MKKNTKTTVIFKKDRKTKEIIAFMPYIFWNFGGDFTCYAHIGQHGACSFAYYSKNCVNATPTEYESLKQELLSIGYDLDIKKKMDYNLFRKTYSKFIKESRMRKQA